MKYSYLIFANLTMWLGLFFSNHFQISEFSLIAIFGSVPWIVLFQRLKEWKRQGERYYSIDTDLPNSATVDYEVYYNYISQYLKRANAHYKSLEEKHHFIL